MLPSLGKIAPLLALYGLACALPLIANGGDPISVTAPPNAVSNSRAIRIEDEAQLLFPFRQNGGKAPIPQLLFSKKPPRVEMALSWSARNGMHVRASFRARFQNPGHTLLGGPNFERVRMDRDGIFTIHATILSSKQKYPFAMVQPDGKIVREWIIISVPHYDYFVQTGQKNPRKFFLSLGVGFTSIGYSETNTGETTKLSSIVVTPKISLNYLMPSPFWSLGFTGYISALQARSSLDATVRFLGLNFRAGYRLPVIREPWQLTLMAGYYFTTSLVTPATFGYRNVGGPQFYPTLRRAFSSGDFATGYFKFSPIANAVNILDFSNREIGLGVAYTFAGSSPNPWSIYLDASQLQLNLPNIEFEASTSTLTLGTSYGF